MVDKSVKGSQRIEVFWRKGILKNNYNILIFDYLSKNGILIFDYAILIFKYLLIVLSKKLDF